MKTDIPRIIKKIGNGRVLVYFPTGEKRLMKIDEYFFSMEKGGHY